MHSLKAILYIVIAFYSQITSLVILLVDLIHIYIDIYIHFSFSKQNMQKNNTKMQTKTVYITCKAYQ